jgi:hypothetical protein
MGLVLVGSVFGFIAFFIGKWRQACILWEMKGEWNVPAAWRSPVWRIGTWLLVVT